MPSTGWGPSGWCSVIEYAAFIFTSLIHIFLVRCSTQFNFCPYICTCNISYAYLWIWFFFMKVYYVLVILNILLAIPNSVCTKVLYISFCVYKCICIIILCAFLPFRGTRTIFVCLCKKYMDVDIFFFVYLHCRHFFKSCIIVSLNVSYMGLV